MPLIGITALSPALSADQIRRLQQGTTELMVSGMRKPVASVAVLVEHLESARWSIAGRAAPIAAHAEAIIGQGTSTTQCIAD